MYTHMKNKHALDPNSSQFMQPSSRGRGRPKRNFDMQKVDPTSDVFLKSDGRQGGPTEPTHSFEDVFKAVFTEQNDMKYEGQYTKHPLHVSLRRFEFSETPGGPDAPDTETALLDQNKEI